MGDPLALRFEIEDEWSPYQIFVRELVVDKTACGALRGYAIVLILHVRTGWPGEEGQVREVPTALRSAANGMLGSSEEWQAEGGGSGVPHDDEPDQGSHGR